MVWPNYRCPSCAKRGYDKDHDNLHIYLKQDGVIFHCYAGCSGEEVRAEALELSKEQPVNAAIAAKSGKSEMLEALRQAPPREHLNPLPNLNWGKTRRGGK